MNRTVATSPPTARPWLLLSILAAALAMAGSVITLLAGRRWRPVLLAWIEHTERDVE